VTLALHLRRFPRAVLAVGIVDGKIQKRFTVIGLESSVIGILFYGSKRQMISGLIG